MLDEPVWCDGEPTATTARSVSYAAPQLAVTAPVLAGLQFVMDTIERGWSPLSSARTDVDIYKMNKNSAGNDTNNLYIPNPPGLNFGSSIKAPTQS